MEKPKVTIKWDEPWGSCECCGSYSDTYLTVIGPNGIGKTFSQGGHLGGGDECLSTPYDTVAAVLEALGFDVTLIVS